MDLLGSIMNSMDKHKPPPIADKQKELIKKQQEAIQKQQDLERQRLKKFKENLEEKINKFLQDDSSPSLQLEPMDKVQRSIVHEVAEIAGLSAFSFGEEDVDRHVVIYKKEFTPPNEELAALRRGQVYNPDAKQSDSEESSQSEQQPSRSNKRKEPEAPSLYVQKYERLLGKETAKDAARKTQMNKQYGFVPSENKKDNRSIEQTLADIRAKKKQKTDDSSS